MTEDHRVWRKSSFSGQGGQCVEISDPRWRKSTYSGENGQCVEVADNADVILVRNSNHPDAGTLAFTRGEMLAFLKGAKAGEFDDLT